MRFSIQSWLSSGSYGVRRRVTPAHDQSHAEPGLSASTATRPTAAGWSGLLCRDRSPGTRAGPATCRWLAPELSPQPLWSRDAELAIAEAQVATVVAEWVHHPRRPGGSFRPDPVYRQ